jgi:hypothetical protein
VWYTSAEASSDPPTRMPKSITDQEAGRAPSQSPQTETGTPR